MRSSMLVSEVPCLAYGIAPSRSWLMLTLVSACAPPPAPVGVSAVGEPASEPWRLEASAPAPEPPPAPVPPAPGWEGGLVELPFERHEPLVVSLPSEDALGQPLIVVTHGAGGNGRTHCSIWRSLLGPRGFIVCPQGRPMYPYAPGLGSGYYYDGHPALGSEIADALALMRATYGERVDMTDPIFAGYSQGASMGALVLPKHSARFARAVLIEGGFGQNQEWNIAGSRRFHENGARRVLLACGRVSCLETANQTAGYMRRGGLEVTVVYAEGAGHSYGAIMQQAIKGELGWLMQGDSRW